MHVYVARNLEFYAYFQDKSGPCPFLGLQLSPFRITSKSIQKLKSIIDQDKQLLTHL